MTRGQVAKELGTSITSVRRLEGKRLHPKKGAGGIRLFDPAEVASLAAHRSAASEVRLRRSAEGDLAAEAFKCFDRGLDIRAAVIELRQPPARIQDLHREWREAGGLWIPRDVSAAIRRAIKARYPDSEAIRIGTPQDLVDALQQVLGDLDDARARHWDGVDQIAKLRREKRALREMLRESRAELADWKDSAPAEEDAPPERST